MGKTICTWLLIPMLFGQSCKALNVAKINRDAIDTEKRLSHYQVK